MTWITTLRDQLPLLLVMTPAIGFLVTLAAFRMDRNIVRYLAISNAGCSLVILGAIVWQFELQRSEVVETRRLLTDEAASSASEAATLEMIHGLIERQRAERFGPRWFVADGINLWPTVMLVVLTGVLFWQAEAAGVGLNGYFPMTLLFESACIAALMAYDLRAYLIAVGISVLSLSTLIGKWGGTDRRRITERFLKFEFCGASFVMFGFAMLVTAVPWMKIEDSSSLPRISFHIATIVFEIQKWTSGNEFAFEYGNEVFPWMLVILSIGFAIQFGLFPFHSLQVSVLREVPSSIAVLFVVGLMSASSIGWWRFVAPIAPDLLAKFDWLILVPSLGGATWGAIRAFVSTDPRERGAFVFLSLWGLSMLGCFSCTRVGLSGAWLLQQQVTMSYCAALIVFAPGSLGLQNGRTGSSEKPIEEGRDFTGTRQLVSRGGVASDLDSTKAVRHVRSPGIRTSLVLLGISTFGFFASGFIIISELLRNSLLLASYGSSMDGFFTSGLIVMSELLRDGLLLASCGFSIVMLILMTIRSLLCVESSGKQVRPVNADECSWFQGSMTFVLVLVVFVNLFPNQMIRQCEPEFIRIFHRFEQTPTSISSDPSASDPQKLP